MQKESMMTLIAGQRNPTGKARRADPNPRPYNLGAVTQKYAGLDPAYKHVNVNLADETQGPEFYHDIGYRAIEEKDLAPNPFRKKVAGDFVSRHGCILMRIPREVADQHNEYGLDGMRGQALANAVSDLLKGQFRGQHAGVNDVGFSDEEKMDAQRFGAHARVTTEPTNKTLSEV